MAGGDTRTAQPDRSVRKESKSREHKARRNTDLIYVTILDIKLEIKSFLFLG